MERGDIVRLRKLEAFFNGKEVRGSSTYVAPKGAYMVVLFLGQELAEVELDADQALRDMGWVPVTEVAVFKPDTKASKQYKDDPG